MGWLSKLFGGSSSTARVDGKRARELVEAGATLLDVRSPAEYQQGHIEGALHIPHTALPQRLSEVPAGPVVVYCRSGMRSAAAAKTLTSAGRTEVYDLGGMSAW